MNDSTSLIYSPYPPPPVTLPEITARTSSTSVSVITVPPVATETASFLVSPSFDTIGYETIVWVANMFEIIRLVIRL